jgi:hypothetical protein
MFILHGAPCRNNVGFIRGKAAGAYGRAPSEVDPPVDEDALTAFGIPLPARSFVVLHPLGGRKPRRQASPDKHDAGAGLLTRRLPRHPGWWPVHW